MSGLQREWLNDPEFSCWLSGVPGDDFFYCRLCHKEINLHGKSSLRAHANGMKHSDLEKEFKKNRHTVSTVASSSRSSAALSGGSSNARVNINLINVPGTSGAPNMHRNVSTQAQGQKQLRSEMHSSRRKFVRERSPLESSDSDSSTSCDSSTTSNSESSQTDH